MKLLPLKEKLALVKAHTQLVDRAFYMALGVSPRHFTNIMNGKASNKHTDALNKLLDMIIDHWNEPDWFTKETQKRVISSLNLIQD